MPPYRDPFFVDAELHEEDMIKTTDFPRTRHHHHNASSKSNFVDFISNSIVDIVGGVAMEAKLPTIQTGMGLLNTAKNSITDFAVTRPTILFNASTNNATSNGMGGDFYYRHNSAMTAVYCVAYLLVFAVGLIGNFFVIAVVFRSPRMRTVTNFFIVNLAVADILVIVFCLPATLMSNIFVREYHFILLIFD